MNRVLLSLFAVAAVSLVTLNVFSQPARDPRPDTDLAAGQKAAAGKPKHPPAAPDRKVQQDLPKDVPSYLQDISVTIHAGNAQGSGTIYTRGGVNYVWTAAHVLEGLRTTREVIDPRTGSKKTVVEFKDAKIVKELVEDGRSVGKMEMDAEVVRYSNADTGEDLALLRVRKKNFVSTSAVFYLEDKIPTVGTKLLHCGSLRGQMGSNSMTEGIMSQLGRVRDGVVYDQTTCTAFPGSSGGGVYLKDGRYVGMIVRGAGETFNLIVPQRRLVKWAKKVGVEFAVNPAVGCPKCDLELKRLPVEDESPGGAHRAESAKGNMTFLIHRLEPKKNMLDVFNK